MQRLGKNIKGYFGERIEIAGVQRDCAAAAARHGWSIDEILPAPRRILGLTRAATQSPSKRIYISTGIHGDEPGGPLGALELLRDNAWPSNLDIWLCPWLNPTGFESGRRENQEGLDLNRQYRAPEAAETVAHIAWLQRQPRFDLCLCLHEDWEANGFYVYEQNPDQQPSLAQAMIAAAEGICPIDRSGMIEGRPANGGVIRPNLDPRTRPDWPEAFFLITNKARLTYTLEAPSDFPLVTRAKALVAAVNTALKMMASRA